MLNSNGVGVDSYAIAAIQRAIQLKSTYNIRVINLSLGHPIYESVATDPLVQAVEAAAQPMPRGPKNFRGFASLSGPNRGEPS